MIRINKTLKQDKYLDILHNEVLPFGMHHYGCISKFLFQQDNCGPHCAKIVRAYLNAYNVKAMKCPVQSLDLNPIANLRAILKKKLRDRSEYPRNAAHLFELLQQEYSS